MPYTPPSHRSPATSAPSSPDVSRRSSIQHGASTMHGSPASPARPALPRSASYLTKHRRTPSANASTSPSLTVLSLDLTPPGTSDNLKAMAVNHNKMPVRQSPPPLTDSHVMPVGAIISPPDSQTSSEDEGAEATLPRGRQIENLKELQEAISSISQHRESSPRHDSNTSPGDLLVLPTQIHHLADAGQNLKVDTTVNGNRRISHNRSMTEPSFVLTKSSDVSVVTSDDSESDEPMKKPQMVRKKSGELVRPALRPAAHRRPSSMPGTPTYSKAVHFDSHLEHVRHFLQVDRPLAVSASSSPADAYESDTEYPFDDKSGGTKLPPYEWELLMNNFPGDSLLRKSLPARVERVWMSPDQKSLIGSIAIANLAFHKHVVCRFTFDYWKTTSEVDAEYTHEIRPRESEAGYDRFQFTIKLSDMANLESKTLFFCVRYNVNGSEYWDNNNNLNFQVDFRKKMLPQNGKGSFRGASSKPANSLPRSNRRSSPSAATRPKSVPSGNFDDFGHDGKLNFDLPIHEYLGESEPTMLRLKGSKSTTALPSDNLANRLSAPSGLAFANRYDFGVSLNAAKQAHRDSMGSPRSDGLYMKPNKKASFAVQQPTSSIPTELPSASTVPAAAQVPGTDSPRISSASYEEIVNKYCFFNGSKPTSPQIKDGTLQGGRYDGPGEGFTRTTNSTNSSSNGSPEMANNNNNNRESALRYPVHQNINPYFQNQHIAIGASPAESPLNGPAPILSHTFSPASSVTATAGSPAPAPVAGDFSPLAGTSSNFAVEHPAFFVQDRLLYTAEAHTWPAIRG